jgi:hypothetical protein
MKPVRWITCEEARPLIAASAAGPEAPLPAAIREHLADCPACSAYLGDQLLAGPDGIAAAPPAEPEPAHHAAAVTHALAGAGGLPGPWLARRLAGEIGAGPGPGPWAAIAALLVAMLLSGQPDLGWMEIPHSTGGRPGHRGDAPNPVVTSIIWDMRPVAPDGASLDMPSPRLSPEEACLSLIERSVRLSSMDRRRVAGGLPGWNLSRSTPPSMRCPVREGHRPGDGSLGDLARARFRHHRRMRGLDHAIVRLADRDWLVPNLAWLVGGAFPVVPALILGLATWVGLVALRHRATIAAARAVVRARVAAGSILFGTVVLWVAILAFSSVAGLVWWALLPQVLWADRGRSVRELAGLLRVNGWLAAPPILDVAAVAGLFAFCAAAMLLHARMFAWAAAGPSGSGPAGALAGAPGGRGGAFGAVPAPTAASWFLPALVVALVACTPDGSTLNLEAPALLMATMGAMWRWLIVHPTPGERRLIAWTVSGSVALLICHAWGLLVHGTPGAVSAWIALRLAASAVALVFVPAWLGHVAAHMPVARLTACRGTFAVVLLAPCALLGLAAAATAISHPLPLEAWACLVGALLLPWLSLRAGALLAPDGAAAFATGAPGRFGGLVTGTPALVVWLSAWAAAGCFLSAALFRFGG